MRLRKLLLFCSRGIFSGLATRRKGCAPEIARESLGSFQVGCVVSNNEKCGCARIRSSSNGTVKIQGLSHRV